MPQTSTPSRCFSAVSARIPPRWKARLFAAALFAGGVVLVWMGMSPILGVGDAVRAGAPLITWWPRGPSGVPAGLALLTLAILFLIPAPDMAPRAYRRNKKANDRLLNRVAVGLLATMACVVLAPIAPLVVGPLIANKIERHGYRACPPLDWERPANDRWASPGARCPRTRQEADAMQAATAL